MHGGLNPAILEFEGGVRSPQDLAELNENFFNHSSEYSIASFMRTLPGQVVYDLLTYRGNHKSCEEVRLDEEFCWGEATVIAIF